MHPFSPTGNAVNLIRGQCRYLCFCIQDYNFTNRVEWSEKKNKRVKLNGQIETSASKEEAWEEINKR